MTISRRDTLRVAATVGASRALAPFAVDAEQAAALLATSGTNDEFPYYWHDLTTDELRADVVDPVTFAIEVDSTDFGFHSSFMNGAPEEWSHYKQALDRVIALAPELLDPEHPVSLHGERRCDHPVALLDELVVAMGNAMHRAGVVQGAAYEHLRLAMTAPRKVCGCNGHGCEACGGRGTLAVAPPGLGFYAAD
jgi:hypothetical protein